MSTKVLSPSITLSEAEKSMASVHGLKERFNTFGLKAVANKYDFCTSKAA
jgi:hypothetical protein